jgi:hypothetical protein
MAKANHDGETPIAGSKPSQARLRPADGERGFSGQGKVLIREKPAAKSVSLPPWLTGR